MTCDIEYREVNSMQFLFFDLLVHYPLSLDTICMKNVNIFNLSAQQIIAVKNHFNLKQQCTFTNQLKSSHLLIIFVACKTSSFRVYYYVF